MSGREPWPHKVHKAAPATANSGDTSAAGGSQAASAPPSEHPSEPPSYKSTTPADGAILRRATATVPSATLPQATLPQATLPQATLPHATVPCASLPCVAAHSLHSIPIVQPVAMTIHGTTTITQPFPDPNVERRFQSLETGFQSLGTEVSDLKAKIYAAGHARKKSKRGRS